MSDFSYQIFPLEPIIKIYKSRRFLYDKREYKNPNKPQEIDFVLDLQKTEKPPSPNQIYVIDNSIDKRKEQDIFYEILTNPYEYITLQNINTISKIAHKLDNIKIENEGSVVIRGKSFIPVANDPESIYSLRYQLMSILGTFDLISESTDKQRYLSFEVVGSEQIKGNSLKPLTDFAEICEQFRANKVPYRIPNEYYCYYDSLSEEKIEKIENPLKENRGLDVHQYMKNIHNTSDIRDITRTIKYKSDLVYIRDVLPSSSELSITHRLYVDLVAAISVLKDKKHIVCYLPNIFFDVTVEILYLFSHFFSTTSYYRSEISDPTSMGGFVVFRDYQGIPSNILKDLYRLVDEWEKNNGKFVSNIAHFQDGISDEFTEFISSSIRRTKQQILTKQKQINKLKKHLENIKSEDKKEQDDEIDQILKQNIQASINWCHTYGIKINPIYEDIGDRLLTPTEHILKLFPYEKNVNMNDLWISDQGMFSITKPKEAELITSLITNHIRKNPKKVVITDATANVGGNAINFAKYFGFVNAVEISPLHCKIIDHNLKAYKRRNTKVYCQSYVEIANTIKQDIVYIDPPWGGVSYRIKKRINLFLSGESISSIINRIRHRAELFAVKGPINLDLQTLVTETNMKTFVVYKVRNYLLVILKPQL